MENAGRGHRTGGGSGYQSASFSSAQAAQVEGTLAWLVTRGGGGGVSPPAAIGCPGVTPAVEYRALVNSSTGGPFYRPGGRGPRK